MEIREKMRAKDRDSEPPKVSSQGFTQQRRGLADGERLPPRADFVDGLVMLSKALRVERELRFQPGPYLGRKEPED